MIALTASVVKDDADKCIAAGCDAFWVKPIDRKKFFDMLNMHLAKEDMPLEQKLSNINEQVDRINEDISQSDAGLAAKDVNSDSPIDIEGLKDAIPLDTLEELIGVFLADNSKRIEQLVGEIEKKDAEEIRFTAHSIKGASASITAMPLSEAAGKIETAAKESDVESMTVFYEDVVSKFETLKDYLGNLDMTKISG